MSNMRSASVVVVTICMTMMVTGVSAEIPNRSPEKLEDAASHVVVGEVLRIYRSVEKRTHKERTHSIAELAVREVRKGENISRGDHVFARYWRDRWIGPGNPDPGHFGHRGVPEAGDRVVVYLSGDQSKGYRVVSPNGFAVQEPVIPPAANEVKSVKVEFDHPDLDEVKFVATPDDWAAIRQTLLPAEHDRDPASWEWVGTVHLIQKDDSPFRVELYGVSGSPGAFAAGENYENRFYFRGGNSAKMIEAVEAAFKRSSQVEVDPLQTIRTLERADQLRIKVARDAGGFYDEMTVSGRESIRNLVKHLKFRGPAVPRRPGNIGSTVFAELTASRKGKPIGSIRLVATLIRFGPEFGYEATLQTGDFYQQLRTLVGDPLP